MVVHGRDLDQEGRAFGLDAGLRQLVVEYGGFEPLFVGLVLESLDDVFLGRCENAGFGVRIDHDLGHFAGAVDRPAGRAGLTGGNRGGKYRQQD